MFSPEREAKRELCHRLDLPRLETSGCWWGQVWNCNLNFELEIICHLSLVHHKIHLFQFFPCEAFQWRNCFLCCRPILGYSVEMYDLPTGNWVTVTQTDDEATRQAIAIWLQQRVDLKLFGTWTLTNVTSCFNQGRSWTTFSAGSCTGFVWGLSMRLETPFLVALSSSIDCNFFMYAFIWCLNLLVANAQNSQFGKLSDQASPPTRL